MFVRRAALMVVLAVCAPSLATAGPQSSSPDAVAPAHVMRAAPADEPPTIDGLVDPEEWEDAAPASDFVQFEPQRGAASTRATTALLMYDDRAIYVAFRVRDDETPQAQLTRRDSDLLQDDAVVVILDTYHDRQTAYMFGTNPLGTQSDARIANDGRTVDASWDAPWEVAASTTADGWSAEFAIPLASLKYDAGSDVIWGVNLGRSRRRNLELSFWAGPLDHRFRISQAGTLVELQVAPPPERLTLVPYGQSVFREGAGSDWQVGIDGRYELTSSTTAFATFNPDFALIEADQETINLTRFEVNLREKRQFFIEGAELFGQRIQTFYSRRIADIDVGGKILGRQGPWTFAGISSLATPASADDEASYGVVRLQRDIGRSSVALQSAVRALDGVSQGSVGVDATLFFGDAWGMTGQLIESFGEHGNGTLAYFIRPAYDSPTAHFHVRYTHLGERFADNVNPIGFIRDDNRRELDSAIEKTLWPAGGPFERIQYDSNYNVYWAADSTLLRRWEIRQGLEVDLRNRFSLELDFTEEFIRFEKGFRNRSYQFELGYNTRAFESLTVGYETGVSFDLDFSVWSAEAGYKFSEGLSAGYELEYLTLDPDPDNESTWIHVLRANQFFTPDLFLTVFFQTNSVIDRRNAQVTFVYRYLPPFGTIQIAYQRGTAEFGQRSEQGNTLFVKATAVF